MGIGISIILLAAGAVLEWGVTATVAGVSLGAIGVILMIIGALGLVWALLAAASFGPFGAHDEVLDRRRVVKR